MDEKTPNASQASEQKPPKAPTPAVSGPLAPLESWLYDVLVYKAPYQLPKAFTDWVVQYGPWITLVLGVVMLPIILGVFALGSFVATMYTVYAGPSAGPIYYLAIALLAVQVVVMFVSIPMLLKRQRKGWLLLFYADILSLGYTVFSSFGYSFFNFGSLLMGLVAAAVGFYALFQIRSYYKN